MTNFLSGRWPQFKKQFWPILYICLTQPAFTFQWPFFMRMPSPWNYIIASIATLAGAIGLSLLFLFPEFSARIVLHSEEHKTLFKPFSLNWALLMTFIYLLVWRFDFYGLSNYWYMAMYLHSAAIFFLLHTAIMQYIEEAKSNIS